MKAALHPFKDSLLSVAEYIDEFGRGPLGGPDDRPLARCPVCKRDMRIRAGQSQSNEHFYHIDSEFCPTKKISEAPYRNLTPTDPDPQARIENIKFFRNNWRRIVALFKRNALVPLFDLKELLLLVDEANRLDIWSYRRMQTWEIPYVMLVLKDFTPKTGIKYSNGKNYRIFSFRFYIESLVGGFEDLWINAGADPKMYRTTFDKVRILEPQPVERSNAWLEIEETQLTEKQLAWMVRELAKRGI